MRIEFSHIGMQFFAQISPAGARRRGELVFRAGLIRGFLRGLTKVLLYPSHVLWDGSSSKADGCEAEGR
jgi:hypothetical protein